MMPLSRRRFLGIAASVPLVLPQRFTGNDTTARLDTLPPHCLLVDAGERCTLRESLTGFARGLAAASIPFEQVLVEAIRPTGLIIIPGAVCDSQAFAQALRRLAASGSTILYESGAAYAEPKAFEAEQRWLRTHFGLSVQAPRELWPAKADAACPAYIRYHWAAQVMIRDFSRAIAVAATAISVTPIARMGKTVVACYRPIGKGALIFLGSPLGPHLGFGDAEARRLLRAFVGTVTKFGNRRSQLGWKAG